MTNNQLYVHTAINGRHFAQTDETEKEILKQTVEKWDKNRKMYPFKTFVFYGKHIDRIF